MVKDILLQSEADLDTLVKDMVLDNITAGSQRTYAKNRITKLLADWECREADVICVLHYAAQKGEEQTYMDRLAQVHHKYLQYLPIAEGYRRNLAIPMANSTELEVMRMYKELGVKDQRKTD